MFRPGKLIHGSPLFLFFIIGLVLSAPTSQRETKKAMSTISRFLRSKTGTSWLTGLAQTKSGPLTTAELMDQLIKATKPDGKVSKSAKILRKALDTQKLKKGSSDDDPDAWDDFIKDLIKDIENQDDIICLYRKNSDSSMKKADDWKKFLKRVSVGYTVHLALDKGKKYIICLKKIAVPEIEDTTAFEVTTQEVALEMTSEKDPEETVLEKADSKETKESAGNDKETTVKDIDETTESNEINQSEETFEPKKLPETRKSRFGPSVDDIEEQDSEEDEEDGDCSEEDDSEDREDNEEDPEDGNNSGRKMNKAIQKAVEDDTNLKPHPECNRPIILVMQNPYGTGRPNWFYLNPKFPKNPLQPITNQLPKFNNPPITPYLDPWNRSKLRYPFGNILNKYPKYSKDHYKYHHPKQFRTGVLPRKALHDRKSILDLSNPKSNAGERKHRIPESSKNSQNYDPFKKYRPFYHLKTLGHHSKLYLEPRNQKSPRKNLEPEGNWYLENLKLLPKTNVGQMPNFDFKKPVGPNLASRLIPIKSYFSNNWNRYNPLLLNRLPYLNSKNSFLNPQVQKCFINPVWQSLIGNQENPRRILNSQNILNPGEVQNLRLNPFFYVPYNQQWFNNQRMLNQQIFPNNQPTFSNIEPSLANPNACKCPSLCDKPIELKITIEGNVDKPVKIGVLSQPGTWVNIVDNNNEGNSRRMLEAKDDSSEDESDEIEKEDESEEVDESESVTENFNDELIINPDAVVKKNETSGNDQNKKNLGDQKDNNGNEEKEEKNEKEPDEVEARILPETTTVADIKSTVIPTEVTSPAA